MKHDLIYSSPNYRGKYLPFDEHKCSKVLEWMTETHKLRKGLKIEN